MTALTNPLELDQALKALWGAVQMPFASAVAKPFASQSFTDTTRRLEQLVNLRASGLLHGPNGVGKSLLVDCFLVQLPEKRFRCIHLPHSSLTGSDLLRQLCLALGQRPRMRRGDNLTLIDQAWRELDRVWPVVVMEEAQNLSATALEEIRLLACHRRDTQPPFSLLLVGDEQLAPRLQMGINAPLLARLSFSLQLSPFTSEDAQAYLQARLQEVGIRSDPFEPAARQLLLQAARGLPRQLNHLAQRAFEEAARQGTSTITAAHLHGALALMPWVAQRS